MVESGVVDRVLLIALWKDGLDEIEEIDEKRTLWRIRTRVFPRTAPRLLQLIEVLIRGSFRILKEKPDFLNLHNVLLLSIVPLRLFVPRTKIIYDTHELESESLASLGPMKYVHKLLEFLFVRWVRYTFVVSPSIEQWYRDKHGLTTITTVKNCPYFTSNQTSSVLRDELNIGKEKTLFIYQGALFPGRGIEVILETFKQLENKSICVVFMGFGQFKDEILKAVAAHENIYFLDAVKENRIIEYTSSADYGISLIEPICLSYYYCLPNKIYEYLMAGIPCVVSNMLELSNYVDEYQVGVTAKTHDVAGLTEAIHAIVNTKQDWSEKIAFAQKQNCWEVEEEKMVAVYQELLQE